MFLNFPAIILSHSELTWLCDCILRNEISPILRGPDYVIILSSQKPIPFWGDLVMWLYFQQKIYPILSGPDHVIVS